MKNISKSAIALGVVFVIAAGLIFLQSCMETTSPSNDDNRLLTVLVYQVTTGVPGSKIPLRNADVTAFPSDGTGTTLRGMTNDKGAVQFKVVIQKIGVLYDFIATYNNKTQTKTKLLVCSDTVIVFVFDTTQVQQLTCATLNSAETLVFTDDNGNEKIKQNTPVNINRYDKCAAGFYNSGTDDITITIPAVNPPFTLQSVMINGSPVAPVNNKVVLKPGQTFTICFSVNTTVAGDFVQNLNFILNCGTSQGSYNLQLKATVVQPTCDCDPSDNSANIELTERINVGESKDVQQVVYTNNTPCPVTISMTSFDGNDGWQVLSPQFPVTLQKGESLTISARFTAQKAKPGRDTLRLMIVPEGTTNRCQFDVRFDGEGCSSSCPLISLDGSTFILFNPAPIIDTLSDRADNRVFTSISNINPPILSSVTRLFYFRNPDSACTDVNLTVSVQFPPNDNYSPQYFQVSPQFLNLAPGEIGVIQVTFTAPDIETLKQIVASRGAVPGRTSDSAFNVQIIIQSPGCRQQINATAVVTAFPDLSPIINLRAYSQRTTLAPEPENEVYYFGQGARSIIKGPGNTPGPYPPPRGDIWIDINDPTPGATPPQMPILKSVSNTIGMKIWQTNMPESQFTNVGSTYQAFVMDPNYSTGYSTAPITPINVRDVIAFKFNQFTYALIYIRRVDTGIEATSNKQSGIEFRSIYPIYIP